MPVLLKLLRICLFCCLTLALAGCGYLFGDKGVFRDASEDYKKSPELPVVSVPEDVDSKELSDLYAIPPVEESLVMAGEFEVPRPAPLVAGAGDELVRIQKLGEDSWALVGAAPGQVWPQVRAFLTAANIPVARADARMGVMDTGWLELQNQSMGSRFRFRIEQGVQRGTSELHVLQQNQAGDVNNWPAGSDNVDQEGEMLKAVSQYLANSSDSAPVSMIADQAISGSGKISLQESPEGYTYIRVALPYERAWASLGRALEKSGFEITDRDRSTGAYYVRLVGVEGEEDGWFDWLFGDDEDPMKGRQFLVSLAAEGEEAVTIRLAPQDEAALEKREEQALLALIKGNIQ
jgi:outer membrane protein assembly factor BamC